MCAQEGAVLTSGFWQDKDLFWNFPYLQNFQRGLRCGLKTDGISGVDEAAQCFSYYYIISGHVCFCLKDTVEAIWL